MAAPNNSMEPTRLAGLGSIALLCLTRGFRCWIVSTEGGLAADVRPTARGPGVKSTGPGKRSAAAKCRRPIWPGGSSRGRCTPSKARQERNDSGAEPEARRLPRRRAHCSQTLPAHVARQPGISLPKDRILGVQQLDGADPASRVFGFGAILALAGRAAHLDAVVRPRRLVGDRRLISR